MPRFAVLAELFLVVVLLASCVQQEREPEPSAADREAAESATALDPLVPTLQVEQFPDSVRLYLRITNGATEPVELSFPTGQSFDFVVEQAGEEVWRWSEGQMFTQAFHSETLGAGETRAFEATWTLPNGARGDYTVRGVLTAEDHRLEQAAEVTIP